MVLNSLQEQSHVASLLGYSSPGELSAGLALPPTPDRPAGNLSANLEATDHLHLAEVLLKTLLLSMGFYTVSSPNVINISVYLRFIFSVIKPECPTGTKKKGKANGSPPGGCLQYRS